MSPPVLTNPFIKFPTAANLVLSVEKLEINFTATTNTVETGTLTKSQTAANCVPFTTNATTRSTSETFNTRLVKVTISGSTVTVTRNTGNSSIDLNVIVYVVEFNPDVSTVQTGTYSITGTSTTASPAVDFVDITKTLMYHQWTNDDATDGFTDSCIRGQVTNTTTMTFNVIGVGGSPSGRWYSVECDNDEFDVQRGNFTITTNDNSAQSSAITGVTLNRTMLITSHDTTQTADDGEAASNMTDMVDTTHVRVRRGDGSVLSASATNTVEFQVIQFASGEGISVQRGDFTITATSDTDTITSVDTTRSMAHSPNSQVCASIDSQNGDDIGQCFCKLDISAATTVRGRVITDSTQASYTWEVVEWNI